MLKGKIGFVVCRKDNGYFSLGDGNVSKDGVFESAKDARAARNEYVKDWGNGVDWYIQKVLVVPFEGG